MITRESFIEFVKSYQAFMKGIERLEEALMGNKYLSNIYNSDWYISVDKMFDEFIKSHFNEYGQDVIYWYLFEDVDKIIYCPKDLFGEEQEIHLNSLEDLWKYLISNKKDFIYE